MALRPKWRSGDDFLVRHVDPSIIVVEKRAGLLTHATENKSQPNLHDGLRRFIRGRGPNSVLPVHRLDRVVSGLLVYARRRDAQELLIEQFAAHDVDRIYVAGVSGRLEKDAGTFESWLVTDHPSLRVFSGSKRDSSTKHAITHWRVMQRYDTGTIVEVRLETGIRNQIRVHFAEDGHPLLGEKKYLRPSQPQRTNRIFLHARVLGFVHPFTKKPVRFEAELPPDLVRWQRKLSRSVNPSAPRSPS